MLLQLDGPAVNGNLPVSTSALEAKVGGSALSERKILTVQPLDGDIYFGYSAGVTASNGTKIFQGQFFPFEASENLPIYLIAASGTIDVRITEVA